MRLHLRQEIPGLLLVLGALGFGALFLAPELELQHAALNDDVLHLAASERLLESFRQGEPLLDPWVSEWSLGYPVWRSYQPFPHIVAAVVLGASDSFVDHTTAFAWLKYLLLLLWPASVYLGARLLRFRPVAAGLASLLVIAPSSLGELGRYGISYGAFTWRGSGLFTQIVALHALALTLGIVARALDSGRHRASAAVALALTGLCHIVFGYVAALSALVLAVTAPTDKRWQRIANLLTVGALAGVLVAWFVIPLWLTRDVINHSRWESAFKWDSYGASSILTDLAAGNFFDAGRPALLSALLLIGLIAGVRHVREWLPRRLLALTALWLLLFFGRTTWGDLLRFVAHPADLHGHRLQAAFELCAVLLGAWGLHRIVISTLSRELQTGLVAVLAVTITMLAYDRVAYLKQNETWGRDNLRAYTLAEGDIVKTISDVRTLLAKTRGRASAGLAAGWGRGFKVGDTPFHGFLTKAHIDQASFLYHSMSRAGELMVLRDESNPAHLDAFGLRAIVAPTGMKMPPSFRHYATHGKFAVYEGSSEGYFGLVDVSGVYTGPAETKFEPSSSWLRGALPAAHQVVALQPTATVSPAVPRVPRWSALPTLRVSGPCGQVTGESQKGEIHAAQVTTSRSCHVLFKMTWDPYLVARVDGEESSLLEVTPGFGAIPVTAGKHRIEVRYEPGPLRPLLLVAGLICFACAVGATWLRSRIDALQVQIARGLTALGARVGAQRTRWTTIASFALLALIALRPLFRGKLIQGHDASEYPPRLVEFARVLFDGHFPPVWAPDLGTGYGQPLFEFAPPLVYLASLPFYLAGANLANALQWGVALLHTLGAFAIYVLARRMASSRVAAIGVATAWLFAPYTALDLYVRGAFAEASAVAMAPVAVSLLLRCLELGSVSSMIAAAFGVALVTLGHNGAALLILPALGLLVVCAGDTQRARAVGAGALALGLAFSAYFWLPALLEKSYVQTDLLREGFLHWSQHSVAWSQLISSAWGTGVSGPGTGDGMSFALGLPQLLLAAFGLSVALRSSIVARRIALTFAVLALGGVWLATTSSSFVWERVSALQYLAYPWRALMLPGLFLPLLCIWGFAPLGPRLQMSVIALLVIANVAHTEPKGYHTFDDEYYASKSIAAKGIRTTTREEYAPRDATKPLAYSTAKLVGPAGQLEVTAQYLESARQEFEVRARTTTRAEFGTLAYPGWRATIDGDAAPLSTVPGRGTQSIEIPPGKHTVVLELHPTPVRRWSAVLSFIAMLGAGAPLALLQLRARHAAKLTTGNQDLSCTENIPATRSGIFVSGGPSVVSTGSRASAKDARRSRKSRAL